MIVRSLGGLLTVLLLSTAGASELPSDSVYQLQTPLESQAAARQQLDLYRGQPALISMFYGSCPHVCPMLIAGIQRMERGLTPEQRKRLRVLMVSLDPQRDSPQHLTEIARRYGADLARWTFARTGKGEVRKLAALLGIQYRQLPDGEFNHSTVVTLLDAEGRILAKTSQVLRPDAEFMARLKSATSR